MNLILKVISLFTPVFVLMRLSPVDPGCQRQPRLEGRQGGGGQLPLPAHLQDIRDNTKLNKKFIRFINCTENMLTCLAHYFKSQSVHPGQFME